MRLGSSETPPLTFTGEGRKAVFGALDAGQPATWLFPLSVNGRFFLPPSIARALAERGEARNAEGFKCPKCGASSGDDWSQCAGRCPIMASPHYSPPPKRCTQLDPFACDYPLCDCLER